MSYCFMQQIIWYSDAFVTRASYFLDFHFLMASSLTEHDFNNFFTLNIALSYVFDIIWLFYIVVLAAF